MSCLWAQAYLNSDWRMPDWHVVLAFAAHYPCYLVQDPFAVVGVDHVADLAYSYSIDSAYLEHLQWFIKIWLTVHSFVRTSNFKTNKFLIFQANMWSTNNNVYATDSYLSAQKLHAEESNWYSTQYRHGKTTHLYFINIWLSAIQVTNESLLPWKPCIFPGGRFQSLRGPLGGIPPGWNCKIKTNREFSTLFLSM